MKHVSLASIEKAIQKVDNLDDDALEELSEQLAKKQEILLGYVMSAAIEYKNEAVSSDFIIHQASSTTSNLFLIFLRTAFQI